MRGQERLTTQERLDRRGTGFGKADMENDFAQSYLFPTGLLVRLPL